MKANKGDQRMWEGITEDDFINESDIVDEDISTHNIKGMTIYSLNVNLARHIVRVADSLKPVERRLLYAMYKIGALPGKNTKSVKIIGAVTELHPHGGGPTYTALVNMAQYWKKSVPLVRGKGNFGSIDDPDGYAADRYTEASMSEYAYECFFEDFNKNAVTMTANLLGVSEPNYFPSKFPNVLVNGTLGIGNGFSAFIPPYNCNDIVDVCQALIDDPNAPIDIMPDFPTECDIVADAGLSDINTLGKGKITLRAQIDIEEKPNTWELIIKSIPYGISYEKMVKKILELDKQNIIKIKDKMDGTECVKRDGKLIMDIDLRIILDKSLDPKTARQILFTKTDLEKTQPIMFTVVKGRKEIKESNIREVLLAWLEERRIYKRSLYNHKMREYDAQIDIKDILIDLLSKDNIVKTIKIIRNNTTADCEKALINEYGMNSHQAKVIANMKLNAFSSDARDRYVKEREELQKKLDEIRSVATSAKKIDKIIKMELEDLRKYATPRKSKIIKVKGNDSISDTNHFIVFNSDGTVRKLPDPPSKSHAKAPYGTFAPKTYPISVLKANNLDSVFIMDIQGNYSIVPVHEIPNSIYNMPGTQLYNITKGAAPSGIRVLQEFTKKQAKEFKANNKCTICTLSKQGMMKKTPFDQYFITANNTMAYCKSVRGAKVKEGDQLVSTFVCIETDGLVYIVFTKKGHYITLPPEYIPEAGKNACGVQMIRPEEGDECAGVGIIPTSGYDYAVVVTEKGYVKRIELDFLKASTKKRDMSYIASLPEDDSIIHAEACKETDFLMINTKSGFSEIPLVDVPVMGRRARGTKMIPLPVGDRIIDASVRDQMKY